MTEHYNIGYKCTGWQVNEGRGNQVALRWVSQKLERQDITYRQLDSQSNRYANTLRDWGLQAGERVFLFLPRTPEVYSAFLGILKAGLVCGTLFSSFGPEALLDRLSDGAASAVVTNQKSLRKLDEVWPLLPALRVVFLVDVPEHLSERVVSLPRLLAEAGETFEAFPARPDTPSVIHYTSGSTGKPKGVQHVHGSLESQLRSFREVFFPKPDDRYWCTADHAWVTGTSYGIIAPFAFGLTQVQYAGGFDPQTWFSIIEEEKVNLLYTAPTVLRMMMQFEDEIYQGFDLSELRQIYSVGEPLNPEIYHWGRRVLKHEIHDTWFQTETGSIMIANRPGLEIRPGSMGKPLEGIQPVLLADDFSPARVGEVGKLGLKSGWPSMFRAYINLPDAYQSKFHGDIYLTGDLARQDEDGYFWFIGRDDDVINTAGHLVSPFEVESSLLELPAVADVGVIGAPDALLWEKVVAFIALTPAATWSNELALRLRVHVSNRVSSMAAPADFRIVQKIPKNRSGKIMRRVLRAWYAGQDAGDLSTMEE